MLPLNYIIHSVMAAGRMIKFDGNAINDFDISERGFWRSFFAAVLVLPFSLMMAASRYDLITDGVSIGVISNDIPFGRFMFVEMVAYVISWTAYPVLMSVFVKHLNCQQNYIRGVVAYNWSSFWQNAVYVPLALVSAESGGPFALIVLVAVLAYGWFVAWKGFGVSKFQAFMLIGLDLSIGIIISFWANRIVLG